MTFALTRIGTPERRGRQRVVTFDMDITSYTTGGEAPTIAQLQVNRLEDIEVQPGESGYLIDWDRSTTAPKIRAYRQTAATSALVEVPAATDVGNVRVKAVGR